MKKYAFTGDIKLLKNIGYKFQKLYARNYKTYSNERIIMYVTSKMAVELDDVRANIRTPFIQFILDNKNKPKDFWLHDVTYGAPFNETFTDMSTWVITPLGNIMTMSDYKVRRKPLDVIISSSYDDFRDNKISKSEQDIIISEAESKYSEFSLSLPIEFYDDIIKDVIELDNLSPLELI